MPGSFLTPLLRRSAAACALRNTRNGRVLADRLIPAFDSASRRTGLLGRQELPQGHAMVIAPSNAVHTCFMRFAIDVAFLSREGRVVKTKAAVKPWRIAASWRGYAVVELPAGTLERCGTLTGDTLSIAAD